MTSIQRKFATMLLASAMTMSAGCAWFAAQTAVTQASGTVTTQAPASSIPIAQNCGVLEAGTPTKFICNGKVYTSFQLAKLRENEAKKYAAGQ